MKIRKSVHLFLTAFVIVSAVMFASCGGKVVPDPGSGSSVGESLSPGSSAEESISSGSSAEEEIFCTVVFDSDGGTAVDGVTVRINDTIPAVPAPTKMNKSYVYEFMGWYYNGVLWDFERDTVQGDMTLVAKWELSEHYTVPVYP